MKKKFQLKTMYASEKNDKRISGVMRTRIGLLLALQTCFVMLVLIPLTGCEEKEYEVTPLPEQFEYIPPSDVGLLKAVSSNGTVTLTWSAPPEDNITKIHILNQNTNAETLIDADKTEAVLTNLTNLVLYKFLVKVENVKTLVSTGASISAIPFQKDAVKPSAVKNLVGFKLNDGAALATWENPDDADLSEVVVYLGNDSIVVAKPTNYTIIKGDVTKNLMVKAVDLSRNYSESTGASVSGVMIAVSGSDDGEYETIKIDLHPAVAIIDNFKIKWGLDKEVIVPFTTNNYRILLSDMGWLDKISVTPMSNGSEVAVYQYDHHNDIPGTIKATYFNSTTGDVVIEGDMSNIGFIDNGDACNYEVVVNETGLYQISATNATPGAEAAKYDVYIDGVLKANGQGGATNGWGNYQQFIGPALNLDAGKHTLTIKFLNGANYQKFFFEKI